jgi:signal transduction histidine kinase
MKEKLSISSSEPPNNEKYVKLRIEISDSGVGIKKENLSKLFMEFGKLDEHSKMNA